MSEAKQPGAAWVVVTDFGNTVLTDRSLRILDGVCPKWREQIHNKRFRNKQVLEARRVMSDLEVTVKTFNRILWASGKPHLEAL